MNDDDIPDIVPTWTLRRGSGIGKTRFHLACEITAEFVEPTRDEIRDALMQILDEALGPDLADLAPYPEEVAGWHPLHGGEAIIGVWGEDEITADDVHELGRLRAWKAEAMQLLDVLDQCHDHLPPPHQARLGESKADAVLAYIIYSDND